MSKLILVLFGLTFLVMLTTTINCKVDKDDNDLWLWYKKEFNKNYSNAEDSMRKEAFLESLRYIETAKAKAKQLGLNSTVGFNEFSDWTSEEELTLVGKYDVKLLSKTKSSLNQQEFLNNMFVDANGNKLYIPKSLDWRESNPKRVSEVKRQMGCGSCWAFATVSIQLSFIIHIIMK